MPTPPFSNTFVTQLAGPLSARFYSELGATFTPRFFCCTDPNELGIADGKEPVAVVALSPNPALIGETVSFDGSDSYDPDGSVTGYSWTLTGGSPSSGTAASGTAAWSAEGTYSVSLIVTDGTGLRSTPGVAQLVVKSPAFAGFLATSTGVWYTDTSGTITWTQKATGEHYAVAIDPATRFLSIDNLGVWRAGPGVIAKSTDGGATWGTVTPSMVYNYYDDDPAPVAGSLDYRRLMFDGARVYAGATWQVGGTGEWRSWLYYTDNAGVSWDDFGQTFDNGFTDGTVSGSTNKTFSIYTAAPISVTMAKVGATAGTIISGDTKTTAAAGTAFFANFFLAATGANGTVNFTSPMAKDDYDIIW